MTFGWIYALRDRGLDRGVKIGRDKNKLHRVNTAQCYTPRGIDVIAFWQIPAGGRFASLADAERVARAGLTRMPGPCAGVEWCDIPVQEAVPEVSKRLGLPPEILNQPLGPRATYDDFRNPKRVALHKERQLLWVYQEAGTGILKVQRNNMWMTNLDRPRTYSALGFSVVDCYGMDVTEDYLQDNLAIHTLWESLVTRFGHGIDWPHVGWLRPEVSRDDIRGAALLAGLKTIDWRQGKPAGLREHDYRH